MARILVIDDDELVLESVQIVLEDDGHEVGVAENGKVGLELLGQQRFDLVITDIFMPEKEGIETLIDIKQADQSIRVLVISGGGRDAEQIMYLEQAEMLGADATLAKPFLTSELKQAVNRLLNS